MIVAIDGPAASGKGTLGRKIADHFGFRHLDTGLMYRAVARALINAGLPPSDRAAAAEAARDVDPSLWPESLLKDPETGEAASIVAAFPEVRAALLDRQRLFALTPPGAVLDGRDIGTVVLPHADAKLFVTAAPEERARRRARELKKAGYAVDETHVLADIRRRDERDMTRTDSPLIKAEDAVLLDTTNLTIEAALQAAIDVVARAQARRGGRGV